MHIHLDPIGGVAGDMFAAALLDAWPEFATDVTESIARCGLAMQVAAHHLAHRDGTLVGSRFDVLPIPVDASANALGNPLASASANASYQNSETGDASRHVHTHWQQIRQMLESSELDSPVRKHAIGIFTALAEAEAIVHGTTVDAVRFHEVGNLDSIGDILAAATLIERVGADSWSVGALPVGGGRVETAHGPLPIPAPATSVLLEGFDWFNDGVPGERVTPTGAAILNYLQPAAGMESLPHRLYRTGHGFGARRLPGMSNVLRVVAWQKVEPATGNGLAPSVATNDDEAVDDTLGARTQRADEGDLDERQTHWPHPEEVAVLEFEIDDQSGESLAAGLDALRVQKAVIDVVCLPAVGKKGRMVSAVRVLARPAATNLVAEACFRQTTTLGVRIRIDQRFCLRRRELGVETDEAGSALNVKIVERPGGATAKADIDGVLSTAGSHRERESRRSRAERAMLEEHERGVRQAPGNEVPEPGNSEENDVDEP